MVCSQTECKIRSSSGHNQLKSYHQTKRDLKVIWTLKLIGYKHDQYKFIKLLYQ